MKFLLHCLPSSLWRFLCMAISFFCSHPIIAQFQEPKFITGYCDITQLVDMDMDGDTDMLDGFHGIWTERNSNNEFLTKHHLGLREFVLNTYHLYHDFDGDGDPDAPFSDGSVLGYYRNDLNNDFWELVVLFEGGLQIFSVFDVNKDGSMDFVFQDYESNFYVIYADGSGGFDSPQLYTGDNPYGFFTLYDNVYGNFDGDEFPDIMSLQGINHIFQLSTNNYDVISSDVVTTTPSTVADINLDGFDDVIVFPNFGFSPIIMDGLGQGDFYSATPITDIDFINPLVRIADFNHDGIMDVLGNDFETNLSKIWFGLGGYQFASPVPFSNGNVNALPGELYLLIEDINLDGFVDVMMLDFYFLNNGNGEFSDPIYYDFPAGMMEGIVNADFDDQAEIVGINGQIIQINDQGSVTAVDLFTPDSNPGVAPDWSLWLTHSGDFDHNGCTDYLVVNELLASVFYCSENGYVASLTTDLSDHFPNGMPFSGATFNPTDFNMDGIEDYIFTYFDNGQFRVLIFYVNDDFTVEIFDDFPQLSGANGLIIQDIDLDGDLDFRFYELENTYMQNDGQGVFMEVPFANVFQQLGIVGSVDLNNDEIPDVIEIFYITEYGPEGPVEDHLIDLPLLQSNFQLIDFNADGWLDIVYFSYTTNELNEGLMQIRYMQNMGDFEFVLVESHDLEQNFALEAPKVIDVDGDQDLDVVWRCVYVGGYLGYYWSENQGDINYEISGEVFFDTNQNGIKDEGEMPVAYSNVSLQPAALYQFSVNTYSFEAEEGVHQVSVNFDETFWSATTPAAYDIALDEDNPVSVENNFGLIPIDPEGRLDFDLRGSKSSCSGEQRFTISLQNYTLQTQDLLVTLALDELLTYGSSSNMTYAENGNEIQWLFEDVNPGETLVFYASVNYPDDSNIGFELQSSASACILDANMNPINCTIDDWLETITCAYSSVEKSVSPIGYTNAGFIADGTELTYTIFFQNNGLAATDSVIVSDVLSEYFDLSTLQIESSSHPMLVDINENNEMHFVFNDVFLTDALSDEPGSQGHVAFRVTPFAGQAGGTVIENTANIAFDSGENVMANTTLNTIFTCDMLGDIEDQNYPCSADSVYFEAPLNYVDQFEWFIDTLQLSSALEVIFDVDPGASYDLILIASNPICEVWYDIQISIDSLPEVLLFTDLGYESSNLEFEIWQTYLLATSNESYTYQWFLDDQLLVGETNDSLLASNYTDYGYFTVLVTNADGCSNSSSGFFNLIWNVESLSSGALQISPNPASTFIEIKSIELIHAANIRMSDGRLVHASNPASSSFLIDVSMFAPGVYFLTTESSLGLQTKRFVVQ
jgi:uncharacterized repeat protein (TIGR01451 family)